MKIYQSLTDKFDKNQQSLLYSFWPIFEKEIASIQFLSINIFFRATYCNMKENVQINQDLIETSKYT